MRKGSPDLRMGSVNANSCAATVDTASGRANANSWVAGQSGNPRGRPLGSRQKIAAQLLEDLQEVWAEKGKAILYRLAIDDPEGWRQLPTAYCRRTCSCASRINERPAIWKACASCSTFLRLLVCRAPRTCELVWRPKFRFPLAMR